MHEAEFLFIVKGTLEEIMGIGQCLVQLMKLENQNS